MWLPRMRRQSQHAPLSGHVENKCVPMEIRDLCPIAMHCVKNNKALSHFQPMVF